ncbi:hypothetical protein VTO73DRAFT_6495 [Trametes versicolor]
MRAARAFDEISEAGVRENFGRSFVKDSLLLLLEHPRLSPAHCRLQRILLDLYGTLAPLHTTTPEHHSLRTPWPLPRRHRPSSLEPLASPNPAHISTSSPAPSQQKTNINTPPPKS